MMPPRTPPTPPPPALPPRSALPLPPLLLAAHGTRDAAGVAAFNALAKRVGELASRDGTAAAGGFIELSEPPLREAVAALLNGARPVPVASAASPAGAAPAAVSPAGAAPAAVSPAGAAPAAVSPAGAAPPAVSLTRVVAVPLMLTAAGHAKGDIPAALARERARHRGLSFSYARPLGPHPLLVQLLADRVAAVSGGQPPAVLVVGRGSTDPDANAEVVKITRLLWEGREYPFTETAFVSLARPSVTAGLERCRLLGARRIVVARYFLFPGVLPDRVADQAGGYAAAHPGLDITCADVLGDCDEIAALVYERYHEALSGDIRMNCDVCVYRVAMPGFEHRVAAPQRPHDHPQDHPHEHPHDHPHEHPQDRRHD